MSLIVHKYGGTSVGSIERIKAVTQHLKTVCAQGHKVVVVVSAMGQQTDELLELALQLSPDPPKRELDMLLTVGERISMSLVSIAAKEAGLRALSLTGSQSGILTDGNHTNAKITRVTGERIHDGLRNHDLVIVAGFQGVNPETKEITTLGRGGSDLTAVALAHALKAERCEIYTDVLGLCSADPRIVTTARVLRKISWRGAAEMAWAGASVIHSRAAHLASRFNIPIYKRSSFDLSHPGTLIEGRPTMESPVIYSFVLKDHLDLIEIRTTDYAKIAGPVLACLWKQGIAPNASAATRSDADWRLQMLIPQGARASVEQTISAIDGQATVNVLMQEIAAVSAIGDGFLQSPDLVRDVIEFAAADCRYFTHNNHTMTLAIDRNEAAALVQKLHRRFIEGST